MKIIIQEPNPNGAYPTIQECSFSTVPLGTARWPDDLPTDVFFAYSGFVVPEVKELGGVPTVVSYEPNLEAWEAFQASIPDEPEEEPVYRPTPEERLRADVDYLAAMMGVEL